MRHPSLGYSHKDRKASDFDQEKYGRQGFKKKSMFKDYAIITKIRFPNINANTNNTLCNGKPAYDS